MYGGPGADWMSGGTGADSVNGEAGNDFVTGDSGNDSVMGGEGNDLVHGWTGNDQMFGGSGSDTLFGYGGIDYVDGGTGNDVLWGGSSNDVLQGGAGLDRLYGESGDDELRSTSGATIFHGGDGNDVIFGTASADNIDGWNGDDTVYAGGGDDFISGYRGADELYGQGGADRIFGGDQNDILQGGAGNDQLYGGEGRDELSDGSGVDYLDGGNAQDTLIGSSDNVVDSLFGASGQDHILYFGNDNVGNDSGDLRLKLVNKTSAWTFGELRVINDGLRMLHDATGNSRLIKDNIVGKDLTLEKYRSLTGGAAAVNYMTYTTRNGNTTYDRAIRFADWNENTSDLVNYGRQLAFVHEVSHNFDNDFELEATGHNTVSYYNLFKQKSGWRKTRTNSNFVRSGDGQWWYYRPAQFYRSYGTINPGEDWGTMWELYFDTTAQRPAAGSSLAAKLAVVADFMDQLS
ncbi:MAG: calcium-binding protein [Pirellulaceae bacterium]